MSCQHTFLLIGLTAVLAGPPVAARAGGQDPALAEKGKTVYAAQKCVTCHAIAGAGNKMNPLDGVGKKLSVDEIRQWITNPTEMTKKTASTKKPPMPNRYSKLPPAELDGLVAYMQSLK